MKTIDTKSVVIGVFAAILFFVLTSGKASSEDDNLTTFSLENRLMVYNKQTKMLYSYPSNFGKINEKPFSIHKISADGSSVTKSDN